MPHTAIFFSTRLTFTTHTDFPINAVGDRGETIDVYLFNSNTLDNEQIAAFAAHYLHPQEQAIFHKRKQQQAQQEYLASRIIIKTYASKYLGYDFADLYVLFDSQDNCLHVYHHNQIIALRCCISHSRGQVLVALLPTTKQVKLGVDLEWISTKRSLEKVAKHYYHAEELQACLAQTETVSETVVEEALQPRALYRIWTLKEALAKAIKQPIAKLIRDNVFAYCAPFNVHSACYSASDNHNNAMFDLSIISDIELTDNAGNTHINILMGKLDQDFRKVK